VFHVRPSYCSPSIWKYSISIRFCNSVENSSWGKSYTVTRGRWICRTWKWRTKKEQRLENAGPGKWRTRIYIKVGKSPLQIAYRPSYARVCVRMQKNKWLLFARELQFFQNYTVVHKKQDTKLLSITLPNNDRFSKFFYCYTQQEIWNKDIITDPATP